MYTYMYAYIYIYIYIQDQGRPLDASKGLVFLQPSFRLKTLEGATSFPTRVSLLTSRPSSISNPLRIPTWVFFKEQIAPFRSPLSIYKGIV